MSGEITRQVIGVLLAFVVVIAVVLALLKAQEFFNDEYVDYSAVILHKDFSGNVGGSPGIDMWRVQLETRRQIVVPSNVENGHSLGDCVTVRIVFSGKLLDRGARIIGVADDCDRKIAL